MKSFIIWLKSLRHKAYIWYCHRLPIQKNKVLLWANEMKKYGDSPKYIAEYLAKNYGDKLDIVWAFDTEAEMPADMPEGIRVIRCFSMQYLKEISTAHIIICNSRTGDAFYFKKRKWQYYIQTWHSSLRLKKIEADAVLPDEYVAFAKADSEKMDLLLSGCRFSTDIFKRAFWYDGEIFESGTPRCDILINKDAKIREKVFAQYGIPVDNKLVLYAPTFRNNKKAGTYDFDFASCKKALEEKTEDNWSIACRLHPNLLESIKMTDCIDMTKYPDMQELIAEADMLITDYSSCMFDAAIAGVPCILYAPDVEEYKKNERGLYFEFDELPFTLCKSNEELAHVIASFDRERYSAEVTAFLRQVGSYEDGHATERVCERIIQVIND